MENKERLYTIGGNVNQCSHMKNSMEDLEILKVGFSYYPAIPFLGIYPKKMKSTSPRDICSPMFNVALFTAAKIRK